LETISLSDDSALVFSGFSPLVNRSDVTESIFLAPEVLESDEHFSAASDVFAFGVVLYFSVTLRYPSRNAMVEGIPPQADCSSGLKKMIKRMWAEDPCGRPGLSEVFRVL
jgi:serine/threonine protein kinase